MSEQARKVGDHYPLLTFEDTPGVPLDLTGARVTYDFVPDSRRAKRRRDVPLRLLDPKRGVVSPPRPRTTGVCEITLHLANGLCATSQTLIRFVRGGTP